MKVYLSAWTKVDSVTVYMVKVDFVMEYNMVQVDFVMVFLVKIDFVKVFFLVKVYFVKVRPVKVGWETSALQCSGWRKVIPRLVCDVVLSRHREMSCEMTCEELQGSRDPPPAHRIGTRVTTGTYCLRHHLVPQLC